MAVSAPWTPFTEPLGQTLRRNLAVAAGVGLGFALGKGNLRLFVPCSVLALWFTLGGHYVEILFLNGLRPLVPSGRVSQVALRLITWFVGGAILYLCISATARLLPVKVPNPSWWWRGGLLFIGIELIAHAVMAARRLPNFYDGRS